VVTSNLNSRHQRFDTFIVAADTKNQYVVTDHLSRWH
jgi:hypothetical protein